MLPRVTTATPTAQPPASERRAESREPVLQMLLEMATPQAYYLCTWLPAVSSPATKRH